MAILLNWWILPSGRVASGRVCPAACCGAGLFIIMAMNSGQYIKLDGVGLHRLATRLEKKKEKLVCYT